MPGSDKLASWAALWGCFLLVACGGGDSDSDVFVPLSNIDLEVVKADFRVTPTEADPEDDLTLEGTIVNNGTETANPLQGDSFAVRFNLSRDGTIEINEFGFLEAKVTDPIPPGGSYPFSYTGRLMDGDTLDSFGDFCTSMDCTPPEIGVIGIKVDALNQIGETDEANNFHFIPMDVVGTAVTATDGFCDFGIAGTFGDPGCDLAVSDGIRTMFYHVPCTGPNCQGLAFPSELRSRVSVTVTIRGCTKNQVPNGVCGGSWTVKGSTMKAGVPSIQTLIKPCNAFFGDGPTKACTQIFTIRDPNF